MSVMSEGRDARHRFGDLSEGFAMFATDAATFVKDKSP
jgi:hypothetical protein